MAPNSDQDDCLRHMLNSNEPEWVLLEHCKQMMAGADYLELERFLLQGYATRPLPVSHTYVLTGVSDLYFEWCKTFKRTFVSYAPCPAPQLATIAIFDVDWSKVSFSQTLLLHAQGWDTPPNPEPEWGPPNPRLGWGTFRVIARNDSAVEALIQQALDILDLPFVRGLPDPPAKTRYERLLGTDWLADQ